MAVPSQSNIRRNPFTGAFSDRTITGEIITVAEFLELPGIHGIRLQDIPKQGTITITENVTGGTVFTIVNNAPNVGEVQIDFVAGLIQFNIADTGTEVTVDYDGRGSVYSLENITKLLGGSGSGATFLSKSVAGGSDVTLTGPEASNLLIELTGLITADINVIVPNNAGRWLVINSTTGAFDITFKTASGTGFVLSAGENFAYSDGTNIRRFERPDVSLLSKSVAGGSDVTLTQSESENLIIELTGLITADINVIVPDTTNRWLVINSTTGQFKITFKTLTGTGLFLSPIDSNFVYSDGTNIRRAVANEQARENLFLNGAMNIAQFFGEGFAPVTVFGGEYLVDNLRINITPGFGGPGFSAEHVTDVPHNQVKFAVKLKVTTTDVTVDAGDTTQLRAFVPGFVFQNINDGQEICLKFYTKTTQAQKFYVAFRNSATDRNYFVGYTTQTAYNENVIVIKTDLLSDGGTWLTDAGIGLDIAFVLIAGSTFQGTSDVWQAGNLLAANDIDNFAGTIDDEFFIADIRLFLGNGQVEPLRVDDSIEFQKCQWRFLKSFEREQDISSTSARITTIGLRDIRASTTILSVPVDFPTQMRVAPTVKISSPATGVDGRVRNITTGIDESITNVNPSQTGFSVFRSSGVTDQNGYSWQYRSDAQY